MKKYVALLVCLSCSLACLAGESFPNILFKSSLESGNFSVIAEILTNPTINFSWHDINTEDKYGNTPLLATISAKNFTSEQKKKIILGLTSRGALLTQKNKSNRTPLLCAAQENNTFIVKLLVDLGALSTNDQIFNSQQANALFLEACAQEQSSIAQLALDYGADINTQDEYGWTGLHHVIKNLLDEETSETLLMLMWLTLAKDSKGVKANSAIKNKEKRTPLMQAAIWGKKGCVDLLLGKGALAFEDQDFNELEATELLLHACYYGWLDVVKQALEKNACITIQNSDNTTPLINAAGTFRIKDEKLREELCLLLLEKGARVTVKNKLGATALTEAAYHRNKLLTQKIIKKGALETLDNTFNKEQAGRLLLLAARNGWTDILEIAVKNGGDPNIHDEDGDTPLLNAISSNYIQTNKEKNDIVELLIKKGACITKANAKGQTPLEVAALLKNEDVVATLLSKESLATEDRQFNNREAIKLFSSSCKNGWNKLVNTLLKKAPFVLDEPERQAIALRAACRYGWKQLITYLLEKKTPFAVQKYSTRQKTAQMLLFYGSKQCSLDLIKRALKNGTSINVKDDRGNTPLMLLASSKVAKNTTKNELALWMIGKGVAPDVIKNGCSALLYAAQEKNEPLALFLLYAMDTEKLSKRERNHPYIKPLLQKVLKNPWNKTYWNCWCWKALNKRAVFQLWQLFNNKKNDAQFKQHPIYPVLQNQFKYQSKNLSEN